MVQIVFGNHLFSLSIVALKKSNVFCLYFPLKHIVATVVKKKKKKTGLSINIIFFCFFIFGDNLYITL